MHLKSLLFLLIESFHGYFCGNISKDKRRVLADVEGWIIGTELIVLEINLLFVGSLSLELKETNLKILKGANLGLEVMKHALA